MQEGSQRKTHAQAQGEHANCAEKGSSFCRYLTAYCCIYVCLLKSILLLNLASVSLLVVQSQSNL